MYSSGLTPEQRLMAVTVSERLPFVFEASGSGTHFTNGYDPIDEDPGHHSIRVASRRGPAR